jgi:hypothetical protein
VVTPCVEIAEQHDIRVASRLNPFFDPLGYGTVLPPPVAEVLWARLEVNHDHRKVDASWSSAAKRSGKCGTHSLFENGLDDIERLAHEFERIQIPSNPEVLAKTPSSGREANSHPSVADGPPEDRWKSASVVDLLKGQDIGIQMTQYRFEVADIGPARKAEVGILRAFVEGKVPHVPRDDPHIVIQGGRRKFFENDLGPGKATAPQTSTQYQCQQCGHDDRHHNRDNQRL